MDYIRALSLALMTLGACSTAGEESVVPESPQGARLDLGVTTPTEPPGGDATAPDATRASAPDALGSKEDVSAADDAAGGDAGPRDEGDALSLCAESSACDDGLECTSDLCTIEGLCTHTIAPGACLIEGQCVVSGALHPDNPCLQCEPSSDPTQWIARNQASCDDGDPCTDNDACDKDTCAGVPLGSCCGNGVVEEGETCDGDCPESCGAPEPCTVVTLTGAVESCDLACVSAPVALCVSGDGCCPEGCQGEDIDCPALCGNGVIDEGELCDGDCPEGCDDGDPCTDDVMSGSVGTCDLACSSTLISLCAAGDGCCPAGCNALNDAECEPVCGNGVVEAGEACDEGDGGDSESCTASCTLSEPAECEPLEEGLWVGDVYWPMAEESDPGACLEVYFTHAEALAICEAKGAGWKLPSIAQADALLDQLSPQAQSEWLPLIGNGGTQCQQMQQSLNAVWWLEEHDGSSGGAALFCSTASCYTTGTQMGDSYLYRVRCVQTECEAGSDAAGCPALCGGDDPPPPGGPATTFAWADNGTGMVSQLDLQSEAKSLVASGQNFPMGIAYDPTTQTLFWSAYTTHAIYRRVLPDGPIMSFSSPGEFPAALVFDPQGQRLYWTEAGGGALRRATAAGDEVETLVEGISFSVGLDLDLSAGKVYWSEEGSDIIRRANLDGSVIEDVVISGIDQPRGLTLYGGSVYWVDRGTQSLRRQSVAGGEVEVLATGFLFLQDVDIDPVAERAYIIDDGVAAPGSIYTLDLPTKTKSLLVENLMTPKHGVLWSE